MNFHHLVLSELQFQTKNKKERTSSQLFLIFINTNISFFYIQHGYKSTTTVLSRGIIVAYMSKLVDNIGMYNRSTVEVFTEIYTSSL